MRLLLVDPDGVNRYTISKTLQRAGYVVADVDSGEVALERYNKSDYDLILAEIDLPGISGLELLREIKQSDPDAIVILVTERANLDDAVQALRLGAKDYLVKPYSSEEIRASVESGIEEARMLRRRRRLLDTIERNVFELAREVSASGQETVGTIEADSAAQRDLVSPRGSAITLGPLSVIAR